MYYFLSKLFWILVRPGTLLVLFLAAAALLTYFGFNAWAVLAAVTLATMYLIVSCLPIGPILLRALEGIFPPITGVGEISGIVVLSGGSAANVAYCKSERASVPEERLQAGVELALSHPNARFLYSGRSGDLGGTHPHKFILDAGVTSDRVILNDVSRTTAQNAVNAATAISDAMEGRWVLVTSAYHMKRALAAFHKAGWNNLVPCPVAHASGSVLQSARSNRAALSVALKEHVGLIGYRLSGRA